MSPTGLRVVHIAPVIGTPLGGMPVVRTLAIGSLNRLNAWRQRRKFMN